MYRGFVCEQVIYRAPQMHTGANEFGQLGDGTEKSSKEPKKVKALETEFVKSVSCGAHCTAAIAEPRENDGTVSKNRLWVWGQNQVT
jgi:alpha-tubulin suppressor-like RCC1 family protein